MPESLRRQRLLDRLRTDPIPSTVPGSLPVLFFGDLHTASIATIGINPSRQEYLTCDGDELEGAARRFETLRSLDAPDRASIDDAKATRAIERMKGYFDSGRPIYSWFASLNRVVEGLGFSFQERTAAHLDLVQEATNPVWSGLTGVDREQATSILHRDLPFLQWQIEHFPLRAVICTSARVLREVGNLLGSQTVAKGDLARIKWTVAVAHMQRGVVGIAGWNMPLARPTGLDRLGHHQLGSLLAEQLMQAGVSLRSP